MKSLTSLTARQLRRAADMQERIESLTAKLNNLLGGPGESVDGQSPPTKRRMSAAGRAAIAAGARARWARVKETGQSSTKKRKRRMSAATKARLAAAARERWKKAKAQGKSTL